VLRLGRFYNWLYYRCYRYSQRADMKWSAHWANASVYAVMLLEMNVMATLLLILFALPPDLTKSIPLGSKWLWFSTAIVVALLNMLLVWTDGRYKQILRRFSHETPEQQQHGDRLFGRYLVISVFALFAVFAFGILRVALR
jgi:hypothetical protein